jgi:hypothetical protein
MSNLPGQSDPGRSPDPAAGNSAPAPDGRPAAESRADQASPAGPAHGAGSASAGAPASQASPGEQALRAADADRDRVAEILRQAAGEGRLTLEELDERLDRTYAARTYAELEPITRDLPEKGAAAPAPAAARAPVSPSAMSRFAMAIMSGFERTGHWVVGRTFTAFALMGGGSLDLREATIAEGQVTIRAFTLMGGIEVIVPETVELHVHGFALMGGIGRPRGKQAPAGAPVVVVTGFALMGGIDVRQKPPRGSGPADEDRPTLYGPGHHPGQLHGPGHAHGHGQPHRHLAHGGYADDE